MILIPFDILCILKFLLYLYVFFIRTSKIFMSFNVVFCEGLRPQNVIIFIFHEKVVFVNGENYWR